MSVFDRLFEEGTSTSIDVSVKVEEAVSEAVAEVEEAAEVEAEIVEEEQAVEKLKEAKARLEFVSNVISKYGINDQFNSILQFMEIGSMVRKASDFGLESHTAMQANLQRDIRNNIPKFDVLIDRKQARINYLKSLFV